MSTFIKKLTNPKTGKEQMALCWDDYYGRHIYGYGFKQDGSDVTWEDKQEEMDFYRHEELK